MGTPLDNRVALVIGGTGEIGTTVCKRLFLSGAKVVTDASGPADEWRIKLAESGCQVTVFQADVRDFDDCARLIESVEDTVGPVDIVVNVPARMEDEVPFEELDRTGWDQAVSGTVDVLFNVCRHVAERMSNRGFGRIINIASVTGRMGREGRCHHAAASAGVHGFTMALAQELARKGVTVNTVSPGVIDAAQAAGVPAARAGTPEEVAQMVDFLCSERAAYINGTDIAVNGGLYMHY